MTAPELPRWKWIEVPLFSLRGTSIDVSPMAGLAILFFLALVGLVFARRKTPWRYVTLGLSSALFVLAVHRTMCVLRGWIFGIQMIGYDDLLAFTYLHVAAGLVAIALVGGGLFCGWMCPVGALQEVLGRVSQHCKRIFSRRVLLGLDLLLALAAIAVVADLLYLYAPADFFMSENVSALFVLVGLLLLPVLVLVPALDERIRWFRYASLGVRFAIILVGVWATNPGCTLYENEVDYSSIISLVGVLAASVVLTREYCRYICPFGALFGLLARVSLLRIEPTCAGRCGQCKTVCTTGALEAGRVNPMMCIMCGRCLEHCASRLVLREPIPERPPAETPEGGRP